jgi:hypothetical protein
LPVIPAWQSSPIWKRGRRFRGLNFTLYLYIRFFAQIVALLKKFFYRWRERVADCARFQGNNHAVTVLDVEVLLSESPFFSA